MWYQEMFEVLESNCNQKQAQKMQKYMKDNFLYLGIPTPLRKQLTKDFLLHAKKTKVIDYGFIKLCFEKEYREAVYVAIDYITLKKNLFEVKDIEFLKSLIVTKSWWDSVDGLDVIIGTLVTKYKELKKTMIEWSKSDNIWLKRVAIDHQLQMKDMTDKDLLSEIIINCMGSNEFFINKAIGWSLREYSKSNKSWVKDFIVQHADGLSKLSIREASIYIK